MLLRQLFQHIRRGGIACFGLLPARKLQLSEQDLSQLFGGIDVEFLPGLLMNALFQLPDPFHQRAAVILQRLRLHPDPFHLHLMKHPCQRHLDLGKQPLHTGLPQLFGKHGPGRQDGARRASRILRKLLRPVRKDLLPAAFPEQHAPFLPRKPQMLMGDIRDAVIVFQRIEQIGRDQHVEQVLRLLFFQISVLELDLEGTQAHALPLKGGKPLSHIIRVDLLRTGEHQRRFPAHRKGEGGKPASIIAA